tara:strand:+ start:9694 stop:10569 length:876 start_codon:yes stop_codon:yes gene_type:complete
MYFYVFIDPEIISEATEHGQMGLGRFVEVLKGFRTDCLMAETDLWRVGEEIKGKIKAIALPAERKEILELIIHLWKQGPFVEMKGDGGEEELVKFAVEVGDQFGIDLIFTPSINLPDSGVSWEASTLTNLHSTRFSQTRGNIGKSVRVKKGELSFESICEKHFGKMVAHARKITIVDYALGEYLGGSQYQNVAKWVRWLEFKLECPKQVELVFKTVNNSRTIKSLSNLIRDLNQQVELNLVLNTAAKGDLPHRRFLIVEGKCLDIDLGVDICDEDDKCRSVEIAYTEGRSR